MPQEAGSLTAYIQESASGNSLAISASGAAKIDGSASTQPVNTSQVNGTATAAGSGVVTAGTQRVTLATDVFVPSNVAAYAGNTPAVGSGTANTGTVRAILAIDQTAIPATQSGTWNVRLQDVAGTGVTSTSINGRQALDTRRADVALIAVTATGVAGAAVTCTLPAAASVFHYINTITITKYATAALTGVATPVVVTTTNLPGNLAFTFGTAQAIGTTLEEDLVGIDTLRSSVVNTATTFVCPATANVIWRVNVYYYTTG